MNKGQRLCNKHGVVVVGVSAGGLKALATFFQTLRDDFPIPVLVVQHLGADSSGYHVQYLKQFTDLVLSEAEEKVPLEPAHVYFAPPNYHLMVDYDKTIALSADKKVNFSRPSIDVLFESAAYVYSSGVIGIILTGANSDGAMGLKLIKSRGGIALVQDPEFAYVDAMPLAAIEAVEPDAILSVEGIAQYLNRIDFAG